MKIATTAFLLILMQMCPSWAQQYPQLPSLIGNEKLPLSYVNPPANLPVFTDPAQISDYVTGTAGAAMSKDAANATLPAARTNLGLGTGNSPTFTELTLTGMTAGSVLFAGTGGVLSQDNASLFLDNTNNRLGIGTTAPLKLLHIHESADSETASQLLLQNMGGGINAAAIGFQVAHTSEYTTLGPKGGIAYQRTSSNGRGNMIFYNRATDDTSAYTAGDAVITLQLGGNVGIGNTIPAVALDVGATASAMRVRNLFTDASNGEWFGISWAANVATIGAEKNGTGTVRPVTAAGTWTFTAPVLGAATATSVTTSATDFLHKTSGTLTGGGTANVPTLTAGPVAGNPTKWVAINDNGTTRHIPAW